jgi:ElaB/YqjD/DUF883 family membrane-anchored ribosome-binding protein
MLCLRIFVLLLVRLGEGLRKTRKKKVRKSNETRKSTRKRQKERKTGTLPGSDRYLTPVPLPGIGLAAAVLLGALGGGILAGAGLRGWGFVLSAARG